MTVRGHMRAVRISRDHKVEIVEMAVPVMADDEVLVAPCHCGICGTDLHIMRHGFPGTNYPVIPGHEFAGHVVAVGRGVAGFREGDFIAADPNVVCGTCRWCRSGRPNLCPELSPIGVGRPGAAAEYVNVPARNMAVVRESLGGELAALIEPLACVLHAVESSRGVRGRTVLVLGGGTMGMLIAIVCKLHGADRVVLADPVATKRAVALKANIDEAVAPAALGDSLFDVVFEAAGVGRALEQAMDLVEKTGVLVQVGVHDEGATVPCNPFGIYEREISIIGSNSCADKFLEAVDVMYDIRDKAALLIGQSREVWDFEKAVEDMSAGTTIKTQLRI
ncbi:MAG: alcohol dehydrogenase catalytic domain-containing protein [Geminicoccaceae bacterium]